MLVCGHEYESVLVCVTYVGHMQEVMGLCEQGGIMIDLEI